MNGTVSQNPTICLNMIVKDEAKIILRCLESVKPFIDYWVICDTGSTDGTQEIVKDFLSDVPGELIERPWQNFGHNRNEALQHANGKADYVFTMDADDWFEAEEGFRFEALVDDAYFIKKVNGNTSYWVPNIVKSNTGWYWEGVIHEYLDNDNAYSGGEIQGAFIHSRREGARSDDPAKYLRDAALLTTALVDDPQNTRSQFYLAQSLRDADEFELAIHHYRKRIELGGWEEEIFCSYYQIALAMEELEQPWPSVQQAYLDAWTHTPERAEPLFRIGANYFDAGNYVMAKFFMERAAEIPLPEHLILFLNSRVYNHLAAYYAGASAELLGKFEDAINHYQTVIARCDPDEQTFAKGKDGLARCKEQLGQGEESAA